MKIVQIAIKRTVFTQNETILLNIAAPNSACTDPRGVSIMIALDYVVRSILSSGPPQPCERWASFGTTFWLTVPPATCTPYFVIYT